MENTDGKIQNLIKIALRVLLLVIEFKSLLLTFLNKWGIFSLAHLVLAAAVNLLKIIAWLYAVFLFSCSLLTLQWLSSLVGIVLFAGVVTLTLQQWLGLVSRRLLGTFLSIRWPQWENPGSNRLWCVPAVGGIVNVSFQPLKDVTFAP